MPVTEREEEVAHREAEHAVVEHHEPPPPVGDAPADSPVERRPADLEQTPSPRED